MGTVDHPPSPRATTPGTALSMAVGGAIAIVAFLIGRASVQTPLRPAVDSLSSAATSRTREFQPVTSASVHSVQQAALAPASPPQIQTLNFSGTGQQATSPADFEKALYVFKLNHSGERNFAVWVMDPTGNKVELLVNTIGPFSGSKAVQIAAKGRYLLDVTADGDWSITAGPP